VQTGGKLEKFIERLNALISVLEQRNNVQVQSRVNQFYYMQKVTELKVLEENMQEAEKRLRFLEDKLKSEYKEVYCRWKKDARWLNAEVHVSEAELKMPDTDKNSEIGIH
jgi:hypothetical protein